MKNLIDVFPFFNFKKGVDKKLDEKKPYNKLVSVHRRRDLDSLGEFIKF